MPALKPKGHIIISLSNKYGRFMLEIGRWIFRLTNHKSKWVDFFMRQEPLGEELDT